MNFRNISIIFTICIIIVSNSGATESIVDLLEQEQHAVKYSLASASMEEGTFVNDNIYDTDEENSIPKYKSPAKAFAMSLLVPGLGQFYNGSKIKPVFFLGVEVASWVLYSKWDSKGDDLTAEFEAFHDSLWSRSRYEDKYLLWTYGETDDNLITAHEVSHHLPDTKTQQYYEMTGKYDQFAWGWDDAQLGNKTLDSFSVEHPPAGITGDPINTPYSANRIEIYEPMRKEADDNYRKANRMIILSVANHVISAFEAFIMAKRFNNNLDKDEGSILSQINIKPSVKSYNSFKDTPYLTLTYKF
ncbi:MAG: DUF5683 domain-containing protein [bacterium]